MKLKVILSIIILTGALGQLYSQYMNGLTYNKLIPRDKRGFVLDANPVKITATEEEQKRYKGLLSITTVQDVQKKINEAEQNQRDNIQKLDAIAGVSAAAEEADATGNKGEALAGQAKSGVEDGLPSLPPVEPESGQLPPLPENPEAGNPASEDASLPPPPEEFLPSKDAAASQAENQESISAKASTSSEPTGGTDNVAEMDLNSDMPIILGPQVKDEPAVEGEKAENIQSENNHGMSDQEKIKLLSCKTKDSQGRIPALIWNRLIDKSGVTEHVANGTQSLPEIATEILKDKDCWPKLWSMNPELESPYDIPLGFTIHIMKDEVRMPAKNAEDSEPVQEP